MKKFSIMNEICFACRCKLENDNKKQVIEVEVEKRLYLMFFSKKKLVDFKQFLFNENEWDYEEEKIDKNFFECLKYLTKDLFDNVY